MRMRMRIKNDNCVVVVWIWIWIWIGCIELMVGIGMACNKSTKYKESQEA